MPVARLVRAQFLSLREKEFVEAARGLGVPSLRQVVRHILPNAIGPVIVAASLDVAAAIIAESSLSFRTSRPGAGSSSTRRTTSTSRPTGRSFPARRSS
jgi:ABC-type microcin C transport system permease subunit YejE